MNSASVEIIRRPVKHVRVRVRDNAHVELIVPSDFTADDTEAVLCKKAAWIERQQTFFRDRPRDTPILQSDELLLFGQVFRWVYAPELARRCVVNRPARTIRVGSDATDAEQRRRRLEEFARVHLSSRVQDLARKHGLRYGRCFVLSQKTRWGSCSKRKNVSVNWRLIAAPEHVIDYVIIHELVHTQVMDHSQRFWIRLAALCPDYKRAVDWLQRNYPEQLTA